VLLITDGRPTRSSEADVLAAARALRERGVALFAVGLGFDVNPDLLRRVAGAPGRYHESPQAEGLRDALRSIYAQIAYVVPCDPRQFWAGRP
jgi:Mg-chelatase subunit ChlD